MKRRSLGPEALALLAVLAAEPARAPEPLAVTGVRAPAAPRPPRAEPVARSPFPRPSIVSAPPQRPTSPPDALLAAVPSTTREAAVVIELSALLHSELGAAVRACLLRGDAVYERLSDAGFDATVRLDRLALVDGVTVLTGDFEAPSWRRLLPEGTRSRGFGSRGELSEAPLADGGSQWLGVWAGQALVLGPTEGSVAGWLDRLERPPGGVAPVEAGHDLAGTVSPEVLVAAFGAADPNLAKVLRAGIDRVQVRGDLSGDLTFSANLDGSDRAARAALRAVLEAGLNQLKAAGAAGEGSIADHVVVAESPAGLVLEARVPRDVALASLRRCAAFRARTEHEPAPAQ